MARHAKKTAVTDNGTPSRKKKVNKPKDESDDEAFESAEETTPPKVKNSSIKKSNDEGSESSEDDVKESESDSEPSPSKKKKVEESQSDDSEENYESDNEPKLVKKKGRPAKKIITKAKSKPKPKVDDYEVEAIVGDRTIKGHVQYKVRWKGYGSDDDTWEGEDNLNCPDLIEEYNDTRADDEAKSAKKKGETSPSGGRDSGSDANERASKKKKTSTPKGKKEVPSEKKSSKTASVKPGSSSEENPGPMPDGEYKVSRIIDMHTLKTGKKEYLVRWQGWSEKDDTWEPEENLAGNDKLEKFLSKLEKIKEVDTKELRVNRTVTDHFSAGHQSKALAVEGRIRGSKRFQNKASNRSDAEDQLSGSDQLPESVQQGSEDRGDLLAGRSSFKTGKRRRAKYRLGRLSRDVDAEERKLALEERQASIEERKLRLSEKRLDFEMNEREVRLASEIEDRKLLTQLSSSVQEQNKLIKWIADKLGYDENESADEAFDSRPLKCYFEAE